MIADNTGYLGWTRASWLRDNGWVWDGMKYFAYDWMSSHVCTGIGLYIMPQVS